jgi:hypothetical protein
MADFGLKLSEQLFRLNVDVGKEIFSLYNIWFRGKKTLISE